MSVFRLFVNHQQQGSFVNRLRKQRFLLIQEKIEQLIAARGSIKILDIGGDIGYWKQIGWKHPQCTIYLLNLYIPSEAEATEGFVFVKGDALQLPYQYGEFDLVFSNSVIEHVGSYANQEKFAAEVMRVCDRYIIQTPSYWFPLEPHSLIPFFQFIPHRLRALLIMAFNINYFPKQKNYQAAVEVSHSTLMLTRQQFQRLFPQADLQVEKLYGIPKSYTVVKC